MTAEVELKLIGEKTLHHEANPLLVTYCPSMELLALGSSDQQVSLYRLNGQRIYSVAQKGTSLAVNRICWKPNGNSPKGFDEFVTDSRKASYLQWLGVMASYVLLELKAAKRFIRLLLDPMEQLVSHVLDGCRTPQEKEGQSSELKNTDLLGKIFLKKGLMALEIKIPLTYLGVLH